jgi:hypothetical protein
LHAGETYSNSKQKERENRNVLKSYHTGSKSIHIEYILLTTIYFTKTNDNATSFLAGFVLLDYDY